MYPVAAVDARVLIGAYALGTPDDLGAWQEGLAALEVDGVEHPLAPEEPPDGSGPWFAEHWDVLVTCIPVVMARLATDPRYGLASSDDDGRAAAVHDVRRAFSLGRDLAAASGHRRVIGVEVHSAPGPLLGSPDALSRSLAELLDEDRAGAELVVEHCDRLVPGQVPAKGFLSLQDEIAAVHAVAGHDAGAGVGIGLNWGRSAIEGRSTSTPAAHARVAAVSGLLRSAILSGASDRPGLWGDPWADAHIPPRGLAAGPESGRDSLLGPDEATRFFHAAGPVPIVGTKVAVRPAGLPTATLLEVARAAVDVTRAAYRAARP